MTLRGTLAEPTVSRVQLGPDPGLFMNVATGDSVDASKVYEWLTDSSTDWETGVQVGFGLRLWLALHEPDMVVLTATGDLVERGIVPPLMGFGGEWKSVSTSVLVGQSGLAALMRPPGEPVRLYDACAPSPEPPFELFVRQFGSDESLARRLIGQVQTWNKTGRPSSKDWRIRAYPKHSDYDPSANEQMIEKQWTRLVFDRISPGT